MNIQSLLTQFVSLQSSTVQEILIQSLVLAVMNGLLAFVYYKAGNSLSNRARLAAILPFLSLTTMLIITVVKSSLSLSLGLVGALSIVRFRAAIKDPEELAYIFLAIALGLGFGATQITTTMVFYGIILVLLVVGYGLRARLGSRFKQHDSLHLEFSTRQPIELNVLVAMLRHHCSMLELVRLDRGETNHAFLVIKPKNIKAVDAVVKELKHYDAKAGISLVKYQPLV